MPGDFAEFGVALGGSAIVLGTSLDGRRCFDGYDVFGMIPPPGEKDGEDSKKRYRIIEARKSASIGGDVYYGTSTTSMSWSFETSNGLDFPSMAPGYGCTKACTRRPCVSSLGSTSLWFTSIATGTIPSPYVSQGSWIT